MVTWCFEDKCLLKILWSLVIPCWLCGNAVTTCLRDGKVLSAIIDGLSTIVLATPIIWLRFKPKSEHLNMWLSWALQKFKILSLHNIWHQDITIFTEKINVVTFLESQHLHNWILGVAETQPINVLSEIWSNYGMHIDLHHEVQFPWDIHSLHQWHLGDSWRIY